MWTFKFLKIVVKKNYPFFQYFWMQQIFGEGRLTLSKCIFNLTFTLGCLKLYPFPSKGEVACNMQFYADLFKDHHITGKRLLLLTENDMRDMGVKSKGHAIHLKARHS